MTTTWRTQRFNTPETRLGIRQVNWREKFERNGAYEPEIVWFEDDTNVAAATALSSMR